MKTLEQIFTNNQKVLPELINKAQQLSRLDKLFLSFFSDQTLAKHCHLANLTDKEALVVADSSVWVMKLRYAIPDILKSVKTQPEFKGLKKIRYSVSLVGQTLAEETKVQKNKLSADNEKLWKKALEQLKLNLSNRK